MGGQSSKSGQSSQGFDLNPEEFNQLRGPLRDFFLGILPSIPDAFTFTDPRLQEGGLDRLRTPLSGAELLNIDRLQGQAEGLSENEQLSQDLLGRRLRGDFLRPESNQALRDIIGFTTKNINEQFNQQDLERRSLFARAGQSLPESSPFALAQAVSNQGRVGAIGESTANLLFGTVESERQRQTEAVEQVRANSRGIFERSQSALQASALPRLVDEQGVDRGIAEFQARLAALSSALGIASNLAAPTPSQASKGSSKSGGGGLLTGSSLRFKHDIRDLGDPTAQLMALRPVTFEYNEEYLGVPDDDSHRDRSRIGLVAEEVDKQFPKVVGQNAFGMASGIYYNELVPVLIATVQSLNQRVEELEERL